jgi:hypothetical protein
MCLRAQARPERLLAGRRSVDVPQPNAVRRQRDTGNTECQRNARQDE